MSTIGSVESFQTAAESFSIGSAPGPQNPAFDADESSATKTKDINEDNDGDVRGEETPSVHMGKLPSGRTNTQGDSIPSRGKAKTSKLSGEFARKQRDPTSPEQTGVIGSPIEPPNKSKSRLGSALVRKSGTYTLEPLERNRPIASTKTHHSRHASSSPGSRRYPSSLRSSQTSSRGPSENDKSKTPLRHSRESRSDSISHVPNGGTPISSPSPGQSTDLCPEQFYPSATKLAVILPSLYISIFLVALDRTILGPAIPEITNTFKSMKDIGWYGSAYMLTACGFILLYGRVYTFFSTKRVFLITIGLFEAGSAICGAAQNSNTFILGRAIAGVGSSGIYTGVVLIILEIVPLKRRPLLQGLFGVCFGVASVAGPLLGGTFTGSTLTWRW
jgi:hypothetical protein